MTDVVLFATGSGVIVDVEETLHRAGLTLAAGIRNRDGTCYLSDPRLSLPPGGLTAALRACPFLVPLFTPANRRSAVNEARALGLAQGFILVDPTVITARSLRLGAGSYVGAGASIGACAEFGEFSFVNRSASVGHHFRGGSFVSIGPGAVLAGGVSVGSGSMIGAGAVVLPSVRIGRAAQVAAGAVVSRDVEDGCLVAGNPARLVRRDPSSREAGADGEEGEE